MLSIMTGVPTATAQQALGARLELVGASPVPTHDLAKGCS